METALFYTAVIVAITAVGVICLAWAFGAFRLGADVREACRQLSKGYEPEVWVTNDTYPKVAELRKDIRRASWRERAAYRKAYGQYKAIEMRKKYVAQLKEE